MHILKRLIATAVAACALSSVSANIPAMVGCNLSGGEFGSNVPGVLGTDYFYPSANHYDWCKGQGMALVRMPFRWERVQYQDSSGTGTLNNFLNGPDITAIDNSLNLAESRGLRCILDMHNYAGRSLTINGTKATYKIGSTQLPTSTYANAWYLLAQHFANRASLWGYDIMNEPVGLPNGVNDWVAMAQAAVNAIRQVDMVHPIIIEGYFYAQASSWGTNGAPLIQVTDPANNLIYEAHCYFDYDSSGTWSHGGTVQAELVNTGKYPSVTAAYQVGVNRVTPFVSWCATNNVRGLVGEFGSPMATDTEDWDIILDNFLNYIKTGGNGLISTTQWGGGAWSSTYILRMENRKDNSNPPPVAVVDSKYVLDVGSNWWFPFTLYHNKITVTADYTYGYSFASSSPAATCTFNTADTSTHYPGAGTTQSADLNYTIPAGGYAGAGMHIRGPLSVGAVGGVDISGNLAANHVLSFYAMTSTPGADLKVTLGTTADGNGVDSGADTGTGNWISLATLAPLSSTWQHYEIPLSQIMNSSLSGKPIERLRIGAAPADGNTYDVHIDQVTIQLASTEAAPTVSVATADGGSSYLTGQNVTLVASPAVSNADNSVDYVEFYANGQSLGLASASPYQWTTSFAAPGTYKVIAVVWDAHGVSTASAPITLTLAPSDQPPGAPTGLSATAVSSSEIDLGWSASAGAATYNVLRSATDGGPYTQIAANVSAMSYHDTGLSGSTTYYYVVQAVNTNGASGNSAQAAATTQSAVTIPAAPTGLQATAASSSEIDLAWTASAGATSYNVLRSGTSGGPYTAVASGVTSTTYNDTGLSAGTTYYYVVQAANSAGTSAASTEASATTQAGSGTAAVTEKDIGPVSPPGSASYSNGTYTLNTGSGQQLMVGWTSDGFSFDYQPVSGDCSLTARVATLVCGDALKGEGAVMIRESLATNSAFACIGVTSGRGVQFSYRTTAGTATVSVAGANVKAPYWVRLTRVGDTFTAFASVDGTTWTQVGTPQTIVMASAVTDGFAICNHGGTGTATFDNVTFTPAAPTISSPATATGTYATPFTYATTASDSPSSFAAAGLPDGLSIDPATGVISGTPTCTGTFSVTLTATNKIGSGTATLALTIVPATVTITVSDVIAAFDGQPKTVPVITSPADVPVTITYNGAQAAPTAVGTYAVVATSASPNYTGTASGTLTIKDTTPPVITAPTPIVAEATGPNGAVVAFTASATDNVDGPVAVTAAPASGSVFPLGESPVTLTATDKAGNTTTATFTVTVRDTTPPVLTAPPDQVLEATSAAGAVASYTATATDAVTANPKITFNIAPGSTFPLGTTPVTVTATDNAGNVSSATFSVTVRDTTPPALTAPTNQVLEATSAAGAVANYTATATDVVTAYPKITYSIAPGSTFPLGTTTVAVTATDDAGNVASATFTVTVRDTTPPAIATLAASPDTIWPVNHKFVPVTLTAAVTDNVGVASVQIVSVATNEPDGSTQWQLTGPLVLNLLSDRFGTGTGRVYTITVEARDAAGNAARHDVTVTVPHDQGK